MTMRWTKIIALCGILFFTLHASDFARAEDATSSVEADEETEPAETEEAVSEDEGVQDVLYQGRNYKAATLKNISQLYWRFGLPHESSNNDVNMYFRLHECEIYKRFSYNEFEWHPIYTTMVDYLKKNKDSFNNKFYYVIPIKLGDYQFEKSQFPVNDEVLSGGVRKFVPENDPEYWPTANCNVSMDLEKSYPFNIAIQFQRPLFIDSVAATRTQGARMVERWSKKTLEKERYAYMRIYITFMRLQNESFRKNPVPVEKDVDGQPVPPKEKEPNVTTLQGRKLPVFIVNLDGYEVFETSAFDSLLDSKSFIRK